MGTHFSKTVSGHLKRQYIWFSKSFRKLFQAKISSDSEPIQARAEAVVLLKQLNFPTCSTALVCRSANLVFCSADLVFRSGLPLCRPVLSLCRPALPLCRPVLSLSFAVLQKPASAGSLRLSTWSIALVCRSADLVCRSGLSLCRPGLLLCRSGLPLYRPGLSLWSVALQTCSATLVCRSADLLDHSGMSLCRHGLLLCSVDLLCQTDLLFRSADLVFRSGLPLCKPALPLCRPALSLSSAAYTEGVQNQRRPEELQLRGVVLLPSVSLWQNLGCLQADPEGISISSTRQGASREGGRGMEGGISFWQALTLSSIAGWVVAASTFDLTRRVRALTQPLVTRRVIADTPAILRLQVNHKFLLDFRVCVRKNCSDSFLVDFLQRSQNGFLDNLFSTLSCVVSVPFYTGFLPILFWSGHSKLARQMTLLMAFCDYIGNSIKDLVSAPRPSCPPVRRVTATADEKENAMEYGLPSSHCLNTVCLLGYLVFYILTYYPQRDGIEIAILFGLVCLLVFLIGIGRVYLGMHSVTDVIAGIGIGLAILSFWLTVHVYIDEFVISGQNVTSFWAGLSFLLAFAYPTPELPTPSFEYHAAFDGVAFGIVKQKVTGIQQTYIHFHHEGVPHVFSPQLPFSAFFGRILVGIPTILIVKFCSKAIAKWLLPIVCNTLGIPIISSSYVPMLKGSISKGKPEGSKQSVYVPKLVAFLPQKAYDVDTGIRFLQYAGLAWSVVDLVPSLFSHLNL
ncbi:hypothetical protein ZIOFF_026178 [Zingiber officinale]|uniref:Phosphatidic acid phosphatase type 2/haloperoxidase domain-containing protein n=1 Tax=Zingiber officinale TaxID=94328 RepID=A0A8J5LFD8_ZINOF|nr:hypothetical protein ZIOFF_026178 [Zingiber officinale]